MKKFFALLALFVITPGKAPIFFPEKTLENLHENPEFKGHHTIISKLKILQGCYIELFGAKFYTGQYFKGFLDSQGAFSFTHYKELTETDKWLIGYNEKLDAYLLTDDKVAHVHNADMIELFEKAKNTLNTLRKEKVQVDYEKYILNLKKINKNKYKEFLHLLLKIERIHESWENFNILGFDSSDPSHMRGILSRCENLLAKSNMKFLKDNVYKEIAMSMKILFFLSKSNIPQILFNEKNYKEISHDLTDYKTKYAEQYIYYPVFKEDVPVVDFLQPYVDQGMSVENILQDLGNSNFFVFMNYIDLLAVSTRLFDPGKDIKSRIVFIFDLSLVERFFLCASDLMEKENFKNLEINKDHRSEISAKMLEKFQSKQREIYDFLLPNDLLILEEIKNFLTKQTKELQDIFKDIVSSLSHISGLSLNETKDLLKTIPTPFNFHLNSNFDEQMKIINSAKSVIENLYIFRFQDTRFLNIPLKQKEFKENSYEAFYEDFKKTHKEWQDQDERDAHDENMNYIGNSFIPFCQ